MAAGFLGAIGVDLWKKLKNLVIKSFKYYKFSDQPFIYNPDIYIEIKEKDNLRVQILFPTRELREQELEKSFQEISIILRENKLTNFSSIRHVGGKWVISDEKENK